MCNLVSFWNDILERLIVQARNYKLSNFDLNFDLIIVINLYTSLIQYVTDLRFLS